MVYYFVIGADGSRYGPADIDTLVQWSRDGRIIESTILIERGTERQVRADSITSIVAELRRQRGGAAPVSIERDESSPRDIPTMTHPGRRDAGFGRPWTSEVVDVMGPPTAPGAAPPTFTPPALNYGQPQYGTVHRYGPLSHRSKLVAGLLGIFLGSLGVHRFYLGYMGIGLIQLLLCCTGISAIWGLIEGIICLVGGMTDAEGRKLRD